MMGGFDLLLDMGWYLGTGLASMVEFSFMGRMGLKVKVHNPCRVYN
jgi:hypothetical protein